MKRPFIFTVCFVVSMLALPVSASSDNKQTTQITGHIVDVVKQRIYNGTVTVENGKIINIKKVKGVPDNAKYIMPGFIDAHVHTESSMVRPSEWAINPIDSVMSSTSCNIFVTYSKSST